MLISLLKQVVQQKLHYILRLLKEEKLPPVFIIPACIVLFCYLSYSVLAVKKMIWLYALMALYLLIFKTISKDKKQFYQQHFKPKVVYWLQMTELCLVALPFALFLLFYGHYLYFLLITAIPIVFPIINIYKYNFSIAKVLPTPYLKASYEMNFGFRSTFILNVILSIPFIMSIYVGNENLYVGIIIIYTCIQVFTAYSIFEDITLLQQYLLSPGRIIFSKFKQVFVNHVPVTLLAVPCSLFFKELRVSVIVLLIILFSVLYNCLVILVKYSFFQKNMMSALVQVFLLLPFFIMPAMPLSIILLPFLYFALFRMATANLKQLLP